MTFRDRIALMLKGAPEFERNPLGEIDVRFHKAANHGRLHGYLIMSHKQKGIVEQPIAFSFQDLEQAPDMNLRTMIDLFEAAKAFGWIPIRLHSYGALVPLDQVGLEEVNKLPTTALFGDNGIGQFADMTSTFQLVSGTKPVTVTNPRELSAPVISTATMRAIMELHGVYAVRVATLPEDEKATLDIRIDQIMANARTSAGGESQVYAKIAKTYQSLFVTLPDQSSIAEGPGEVNMTFSRAAQDPRAEVAVARKPLSH